MSCEQVAQHKTSGDGIWVTYVSSAFPTVIICNTLVRYRNAVYDVTEFVENHPGGMKRIMLAGHHSCDVLL